jgi:hypothetical protein
MNFPRFKNMINPGHGITGPGKWVLKRTKAAFFLAQKHIFSVYGLV